MYHDIISALQIACGESGARINSCEFKTSVEHHGTRWTIPLTINCNLRQELLFDFAFSFFSAMHSKSHIHFSWCERPRLVALDCALLPQGYRTGHYGISLDRITFGAPVNDGLFAAHWIIKGGTEPGEKVSADFHYDSKEIVVRYMHMESNRRSSFARQLSKYTIKVRLNSIDRIFIDQHRDSSGKRGARLLLIVSCPPKFARAVAKEQKGIFPKGRSEWGALEEEITWSSDVPVLRLGRGNTNDEFSEDVALCNSIAFDFADLETQKALDLLIEITSSLRHSTSKEINFLMADEVLMLQGKVTDTALDRAIIKCPYSVTNPFDRFFVQILERACFETKYDAAKMKNVKVLSRERLFHLRIRIEAILARGNFAKNQLLVDIRHWMSFLEMVSRECTSDAKRTLAALSSVIRMIDMGKTCDVWGMFRMELESTTLQLDIDESMRERGYQKVIKVIVTPSRKLYVGEEEIMGNRALRLHNKSGTELIRVLFRDDDGDFVRGNNTGWTVTDTLVTDAVGNGIDIAGRKYKHLGSSNSQFRDHGAYFYHAQHKTVRSIRESFGNFMNQPSIPKMIARFGLVMSQAKPSTVPIWIEQTEVIHEIVGGQQESGEAYVFSDGVGSISSELVDSISLEMDWRVMPSAIQMRRVGEKGVMCVDKGMDARNALRARLKGSLPMCHFGVRPSMCKFEVAEEGCTKMEVVKPSQPSPTNLSRPVLNVLFQVAEMQSPTVARRVSARILQLLHRQLRQITSALIVERDAVIALRENMNSRMNMDNVKVSIECTSEPFFRSLLRAYFRVSLTNKLQKMQIPIPTSLGRNMFGVIDHSGQLQYGQIFAQYSSSCSKRAANKHPIVLQGSVMVTKNPCVVAGDVRRFTAVDIPELRHLVDVIVFPRHGPRPHPDEMAGGDLDGDEYVVVWDADLVLDRNEPAATIPEGSGEATTKWPIDPRSLEHDIAAFYAAYMASENVGVYANAHLALSDLHGIDHDTCRDVAAKLALCLDFSKTGIEPKELRRYAVDDESDDEMLKPAERPLMRPDFMPRTMDPAYESEGPLGEAFRSIEKWMDASEMADDGSINITLDPDIDSNMWKMFSKEMTAQLKTYNSEIMSLMAQYGVRTEAEIWTGAISMMKTRLAEKSDDHSPFNTVTVLDEKVSCILRRFRLQFFTATRKERWRHELRSMDSFYKNSLGKEDIMEMVCDEPKAEEVDRAVAAYKACYEMAKEKIERGDEDPVMLSFPWIFYDILSYVRLQRKGLGAVRARPIDDAIGSEVLLFADPSSQRNNSSLPGKDQIHLTYLSIGHSPLGKIKEQYCNGESVTARLLRQYRVLPEVVTTLVEWARYQEVFLTGHRFTERHLIWLILCFGLGSFSSDPNERIHLMTPSFESRELLHPGGLVVDFLAYCSSRAFASISVLSFDAVGEEAVLMRGEWMVLHQAAVTGYTRLVTHHSLQLPTPSPTPAVTPLSEKEHEMMPISFDLPDHVRGDSVAFNELASALGAASGARVAMRAFKDRALVSAWGSIRQLTILRKLLIVRPPDRKEFLKRKGCDIYANFVYAGIMTAASKAKERSVKETKSDPILLLPDVPGPEKVNTPCVGRPKREQKKQLTTSKHETLISTPSFIASAIPSRFCNGFNTGSPKDPEMVDISPISGSRGLDWQTESRPVATRRRPRIKKIHLSSSDSGMKKTSEKSNEKNASSEETPEDAEDEDVQEMIHSSEEEDMISLKGFLLDEDGDEEESTHFELPITPEDEDSFDSPMNEEEFASMTSLLSLADSEADSEDEYLDCIESMAFENF